MTADSEIRASSTDISDSNAISDWRKGELLNVISLYSPLLLISECFPASRHLSSSQAKGVCMGPFLVGHRR